MDEDDYEPPVTSTPHRFGWFFAGGLSVALAGGVFLYATGYFDRVTAMGAQATEQRTIIESKK